MAALQAQRGRIAAIAQARGLRSIGENMADVRAALLAMHFGARVAQMKIDICAQSLFTNGREERRPAAARFVFVVRLKQGVIAANAAVHPRQFAGFKLARKGAFRRCLARDMVGQGFSLAISCQLRLPLGIGFVDGKVHTALAFFFIHPILQAAQHRLPHGLRLLQGINLNKALWKLRCSRCISGCDFAEKRYGQSLKAVGLPGIG